MATTLVEETDPIRALPRLARVPPAMQAADAFFPAAKKFVDPAILADPALAGVIDLTEPVCVLLVSMLHFFTADEADMIVDAFRQRMVPGSYLIISQGHANPVPREEIQNAYGSDITLTGRPAAEIAAYFDGFDLVPPGLVPVAEWPAAQPDARLPPPQHAQPTSPQAGMLAGVGRKRT